jgi:hypothetical protein
MAGTSSIGVFPAEVKVPPLEESLHAVPNTPPIKPAQLKQERANLLKFIPSPK